MEEAGRCVLTLPLLTELWQEHILEKRFQIMEHLQNSLIAFELRKLRNLEHTKAYRELIQKIEDTPKEQRKVLYKQRQKMLRDAGFSEFAFKDDITPMQKHFVEHIAVHIAHRTASNVWRAFDKYLFNNGQAVHFKRRGTLDSVATQKIGNGMTYRDGELIWSGGQCPNKIKLKIKVALPRNEYEREMLKKEICYLRVVRKWVKTRYKYYLQFTLKGEPVRKQAPAAPGRVGIDIGTQSIAIASDSSVKLLELADRVNKNHAKQLRLQRKMDRSRRAMNPENYNPDGTIRRGIKLYWQKSNHYRKLQGQVRELQRKNADIRKYQHNCLANYILSLGSEIYVEDMDYRALQKRAKETTINAQGRYNRKKRFGKSLANKAPAMFLTILDNKLKAQYLGGIRKVDKWEYKASQYDHLSQKYNKKKLSQREQRLDNGDLLQRDMYSAFLLMNADEGLQHTNQALCEQTYDNFKQLHDAEILRIQSEQKPHLSSFGIA